MNTQILKFVAGSVVSLLIVSCDNIVGGGGPSGPGGYVAIYSGHLQVSIFNEKATVTWQAVEGESYKIYVDHGSVSGASAEIWTLLTPEAVKASPATVDIGVVNTSSSSKKFAITRVVGSSESDKSNSVYVTLPTSFDFSSQNLKMRNGAVVVSYASPPNTLSETWELYRLPGTTTALNDAALLTKENMVDTNTSLSFLKDSTLTSLVDASGVPLTYKYVLALELKSQSGEQSFNVAKRAAMADFSPSLSSLTLFDTTNYNYQVDSNGSIISASGATFWTCLNTRICAMNADSTSNYAYEAYTSGVPTRIATNATTASGTVYYISNTGNNVGGTSFNSSAGTGYTAITAPVDLAIDSTYVYVATSTSIIRIAQSALTGTSAASSTIASGMTGITAITRSGTTLYIATSGGIRKLANIDATPALSDVFLTVNPVKALMLDQANNKLYYVSQSLTMSQAGADAIFRLDLTTPTSASPVQDKVFSGKNFQFANNALHWHGAKRIYSLNLADSVLKFRAADSSVRAIAADSSGGLYAQVGSAITPIYLPASYAYASTVPSAAQAPSFAVGDQELGVGWANIAGADAVAVTANGNTQLVGDGITYYPNNTTVSGLTNENPYNVQITPMNAAGNGIFASASGTPKMAPPSIVKAASANGQVTFSITAPSYKPSRSMTMKVYGGAARPVDTTGTPLATATAALVGSGTAGTVTYTPTPNDNIFYYNVTLTEDATASVSNPIYAANSEAWTNSAPATTQVASTNPPNTQDAVTVGNVGGYVYWTNSGNVYRANTGGTLPNSEAVTNISTVDAFASNGATMYGYDTGVNTVYAITNAINATATNVNKTAILNGALLGAFTGQPTAIAVSGMTLYVGTHDGQIFGVDWDGSAASNRRLIWATGGGYICKLAVAGSDLIWAQDADGATSCNSSSSNGLRIRRGPENGTGVVDDLVAVPYARILNLQYALIGAVPYVYYTTSADNQIKRINLATLAADTPVAEQTSSNFAVNAATGKLYFTNAMTGVIYTLDGQNRRLAHATGGGTSQGISLLQIGSTPTLFLYGDTTTGLRQVLP